MSSDATQRTSLVTFGKFIKGHTSVCACVCVYVCVFVCVYVCMYLLDKTFLSSLYSILPFPIPHYFLSYPTTILSYTATLYDTPHHSNPFHSTEIHFTLFNSNPFYSIHFTLFNSIQFYFILFNSIQFNFVTLYFTLPGMLSSHESMHIERLHSMLRLISSNSEGNEAKFDMNLVQLRQFLQTLIDANKIEFIDNTYRIRKH